jgi:hypothetical protein
VKRPRSVRPRCSAPPYLILGRWRWNLPSTIVLTPSHRTLRDQATAYCSIGFQPVVSATWRCLRDRPRSEDHGLTRVMRRPAGDRLEAYATLRSGASSANAEWGSAPRAHQHAYRPGFFCPACACFPAEGGRLICSLRCNWMAILSMRFRSPRLIVRPIPEDEMTSR